MEVVFELLFFRRDALKEQFLLFMLGDQIKKNKIGMSAMNLSVRQRE